MIALLSLQEAYIRAGFGEREYHNSTNLNAVGALVLAGVVLAAVSLKRRHALLPLLLLSSAVPTGQRVAILTLDFNLIRLALLAYAARVLVRGEYRGFRTRRCDQLVLAWLSTPVRYLLRRGSQSMLPSVMFLCHVQLSQRIQRRRLRR